MTNKYTPSDSALVQLNKCFVYHPVKEGQQERYVAIREAARAFALLVLESTPPSREQSVFMTNLEQAMMWANASIARGE